MTQPPTLTVHDLALTSLNAPGEDGSTRLYPVMAVWADLSPITERGVQADSVPHGFPVLHIVDSRIDLADPSQMGLLIGHAEPVEGDLDGSTTVEVVPEHLWELTLPTTWVGLATALSQSDLNARVVLLDGLAPPDPARAIVAVWQPGFMLLPQPGGVSETLAAAMARQWIGPAHIHTLLDADRDDGLDHPDRMRDELWSIVAGVAMGSAAAGNRLIAFAGFVEQCLSSQDEDEAALAQRVIDRLGMFDVGQLLSIVREPATGEYLWPEPMQALGETAIADGVFARLEADFLNATSSRDPSNETTAAGAFDVSRPDTDYGEDADETDPDDALRVPDLLTSHSAHDVVRACTLMVAAVAVRLSDAENAQHPGEQWLTPAFLTGTWLGNSTPPWWTLVATHSMLMQYDTAILIDLLNANPHAPDEPAAAQSTLARRFMHTLVKCMADLNLHAESAADTFKDLDMVVGDVEDLIYVAEELLGAAHAVAEDPAEDDCPSCVAVEHLIARTTDQARLVRTIAALFPLLADLSASGLVVGEGDWLEQRSEWSMRWLVAMVDSELPYNEEEVFLDADLAAHLDHVDVDHLVESMTALQDGADDSVEVETDQVVDDHGPSGPDDDRSRF